VRPWTWPAFKAIDENEDGDDAVLNFYDLELKPC